MQIFIGGNGNITGGYDGLGAFTPENFENFDSWKHVFLDFGTNLNTVNTDKQISHNKASVN